MTEYMPNLPEWVLKEKPHIANCKHCGAEAILRGKPDWEWWTYEIRCSKYCKESKPIDRYSIKELIDKWNELNEVENDRRNNN